MLNEAKTWNLFIEDIPSGIYSLILSNNRRERTVKKSSLLKTMRLVNEYIYEYQLSQHTPMDLKSLEDESILICGGYASILDDIFFTGFTMKLSSDGDLIWSRYYTTGRNSENAHESLAGKEKYSNLR